MNQDELELERDKYNLELAKLLLDEWKWRHQHCWKMLTRGLLAAVTVGLAPYVWLRGDTVLRTAFGAWVLLFPLVALVVAQAAIGLFAGEYVRCRPVLAKYNDVLRGHSPNPRDKQPTKKWRVSVAQQTILVAGALTVALAIVDAYLLTRTAMAQPPSNSIPDGFWFVCIAVGTIFFGADLALMQWTRQDLHARISESGEPLPSSSPSLQVNPNG